MLTKQPWKRWWPYLAFALGLTIALAASTFAPSYEGCATEHHKPATDPDSHKPKPEMRGAFSEAAMIFGECEGEFIHQNEGGITALATIVIALFTLALWRSTDNLWEGGEKQFQLSTNTA